MDFLYRVLGIGAGVNDATSRFSINLIPFNMLLIFSLGLGAFFCFIFGLIGVEESGPPHAVRFAEVLAHPDTTPTWIKTTGNLVPVLSLEEKLGDGEGSVTDTWVPLVDGAAKKGLLVRVADPAASEGPQRTVEITGRLTSLGPELQKELQKTKGKLEGIEISTEWAIHEGHTSADPTTFFCVAVGLGLCCLPLLAAFVLRNVIFRKGPGAEDPPTAGGPLDLRTTGHFILEGRVRQRFLSVPSGCELTQNGELILYANIDASSKFYGFTTERRQGVWTILIPLSGLKTPETGWMYLGLDTRPALRLKFQTPYGGGQDEAVLSFENEAQRLGFLRALRA